MAVELRHAHPAMMKPFTADNVVSFLVDCETALVQIHQIRVILMNSHEWLNFLEVIPPRELSRAVSAITRLASFVDNHRNPLHVHVLLPFLPLLLDGSHFLQMVLDVLNNSSSSSIDRMLLTGSC